MITGDELFVSSCSCCCLRYGIDMQELCRSGSLSLSLSEMLSVCDALRYPSVSCCEPALSPRSITAGDGDATGAGVGEVGFCGAAADFAFALALLLSGLGKPQGASSNHSQTVPKIASQDCGQMPRSAAILSRGSIK